MGVMELDLRRPGRVEKNPILGPLEVDFITETCGFFLVRFFREGVKNNNKKHWRNFPFAESFLDCWSRTTFSSKKQNIWNKLMIVFMKSPKKTLAPQPSPASWFVISWSFFLIPGYGDSLAKTMGNMGDKTEGEGAILSPETETTETCARCRVSWRRSVGKMMMVWHRHFSEWWSCETIFLGDIFKIVELESKLFWGWILLNIVVNSSCSCKLHQGGDFWVCSQPLVSEPLCFLHPLGAGTTNQSIVASIGRWHSARMIGRFHDEKKQLFSPTAIAVGSSAIVKVSG